MPPSLSSCMSRLGASACCCCCLKEVRCCDDSMGRDVGDRPPPDTTPDSSGSQRSALRERKRSARPAPAAGSVQPGPAPALPRAEGPGPAVWSGASPPKARMDRGPETLRPPWLARPITDGPLVATAACCPAADAPLVPGFTNLFRGDGATFVVVGEERHVRWAACGRDVAAKFCSLLLLPPTIPACLPATRSV